MIFFYFQEENITDRRRWLKYWLIYNNIKLIENFLWFLPMISLFKTLFLIWCIAPVKANGVNISYNILHKLLNQLMNFVFKEDNKSWYFELIIWRCIDLPFDLNIILVPIIFFFDFLINFIVKISLDSFFLHQFQRLFFNNLRLNKYKHS